MTAKRRKGRNVDHEARQKQMRKQWDKKIGAFRCAYTGLPLTPERDADGRAGPTYATREHRDPRSPRKASEVVLVAWLVNDMKADLTEREFAKMVKALVARFQDRKRPLNPNLLPPDWRRGSRTAPPDQRERPSSASIPLAASRLRNGSAAISGSVLPAGAKVGDLIP